jgi:hypothetical protein
MLRRIVSLATPESDREDEPMSPSPGDVPPSPDSSRAGGLASVFKGLTGTKLTKSPPPQLQSPSTSTVPSIADSLNATPTGFHGLSPNHMELLEQLKNGTPSQRTSAADSLRYAIAEYPLNPVLDIWYAAKDLIEPSKTTEVRTAGWQLLTECVKHKDSTDLERKEYFQTVSAPASPEDFHLQLAALVDLTNHGRDLSGFDYDVIPLLTNWLQDAYRDVRVARKSIRGAKGSGRSRNVASGEEKNFTQLFIFIIDVIKFSLSVADENAIAGLIDGLLNICLNTGKEDDLRSCIAVVEAIATFGAIPTEKLKDCVQVLSSIFTLVPNLQKPAWHTLSILYRSHNGQAVLRILLDVLRNLPELHADAEAGRGKDVTREARGALTVLQKLLSKSTEKGYPAVPFALLVDGLAATVQTTTSGRVFITTMKLINSLFDNGNGELHPLMYDEDWGAILDVAADCSRRKPLLTSIEPVNNSRNQQGQEDNAKSDDTISRELLQLVSRLETLLTQRSEIYVPRQAVVKFFIDIQNVLPESAACVVLDYLLEFRGCSPSDAEWNENLKLVLEVFFASRNQSSQTRLRAVQVITDAYEMMDLVGNEEQPGSVQSLVKEILRDVAEENDIAVLDALVDLMVRVAYSSDIDLFDYVVDTLRGIVVNDRMRSPITPSSTLSPGTPTTPDKPTAQASQTPSNVVTKGYVKIFIRCMNTDGAKSVKMFNSLVNIAKSNLCETDARLTAMKLLFRLRADWANRVFIVTDTESDGLAASLFRTEASLARKRADDAAQPSRLSRNEHSGGSRASRGISFGQGQPQDRGYPIRSGSSSTKLGAQKYQQIWRLPDPEGLPERLLSTVSPILVSHGEEADHSEAGERPTRPQAPLNLSGWMDALLNLFQQGTDWEVYSFILVHLPSQLSNHAIFRDAIPQIQDFRKLMCDQIRMNSFQEPPIASGLRKADVAICLFHSLTMILSYHEHLKKGEEDEIVRIFVHGIATWERCAKYCIHALSICCHELPLSTSKSLIQMLQKMSQIITQPHVAMHILEFLVCLSRMQNLYSNFREDDYRIVFAICFRYLQYVRERKKLNRTSQASEAATPASAGAAILLDGNPHPNASDDLPQYVYALAYHVITFWFLALKLPDRATHVGWIARNLFTDVDGGQTAEEQALITIDFMQRVAYADADESSEDPLFTQERFGEILRRRWLIGNSIVTVEQASGTGWAQITKRQPSGTSSYMVRETFRPRPPHQTRNLTDMTRDGHPNTSNIVLPSHLMVQLMSSIPQTFDALRPVPLPEDEVVERAIRVFDRNSTVDGHKVGVVYIGEGQSMEREILANVSGSGDYVEFLNGLGTLTKLKGATFNTQGLDREYDSDGQFTFCWRDRVTEIVFHVTTQMPTDLQRDPNCVLKKRHIGNDFVNIIFNDSGLPFKFDTFPSDFNFVNIVITPESRASFIASREEAAAAATATAETTTMNSPVPKKNPFFKVQVMSKPGFPEISPASETKMVSLKALPDFIRLLALNASVFSLVWANREGGEHVSSWRNRLRDIKRLRDKYGPKVAAAQPHGFAGTGSGGGAAGGPGGNAASSLHTPSPPTTSLGGGVGGANSNLAVVTPQQHQQQQGESSRPTSSVRDSFSSLRRSSVATFFTSTSEQTSHRSSMLSTSTTDTEIVPIGGLDSLVESVDFSKWA